MTDLPSHYLKSVSLNNFLYHYLPTATMLLISESATKQVDRTGEVASVPLVPYGIS